MRALVVGCSNVIAALSACLIASSAMAQAPATEPPAANEPAYQLSVETEVHESEAIEAREAQRASLVSQANVLRDLAIAGAAVALGGVVSIAVVAVDRASTPCADCDALSDYGPGIGVTVVGGLVVLIGGIVSAYLYALAADLSREIEELREQIEPTFAVLADGHGGFAGFRLRF